MKKMFLSTVLMLAVISASAQIETLSSRRIDADPMVNKTGYILWESEHVAISLPDKGVATTTLRADEHIFMGKNTKIGYYKKDGTFIGMAEYVPNTRTNDARNLIITVGFSKDSIPLSVYSEDLYVMKKSWRIRTSDIVKWLEENDGYIRIVTETYGGNIYDVKFRIKQEE